MKALHTFLFMLSLLAASYAQDYKHYASIDAGAGFSEGNLTHLIRQNIGIHLTKGLYAQLGYSNLHSEKSISSMIDQTVSLDAAGHMIQMKSFHLGLRKFIQVGTTQFVSAAICGHQKRVNEIKLSDIILDDLNRLDDNASTTKFSQYNTISFDINLEYTRMLKEYLGVSLSGSYFHKPSTFIAGVSVQFYFNLSAKE